MTTKNEAHIIKELNATQVDSLKNIGVLDSKFWIMHFANITGPDNSFEDGFIDRIKKSGCKAFSFFLDIKEWTVKNAQGEERTFRVDTLTIKGSNA